MAKNTGSSGQRPQGEDQIQKSGNYGLTVLTARQITKQWSLAASPHFLRAHPHPSAHCVNRGSQKEKW